MWYCFFLLEATTESLETESRARDPQEAMTNGLPEPDRHSVIDGIGSSDAFRPSSIVVQSRTRETKEHVRKLNRERQRARRIRKMQQLQSSQVVRVAMPSVVVRPPVEEGTTE